MAQLISIQTGRPRDVRWQDGVVRTSIFKEPVMGPVQVHALNLEGDEQSDLTVHGGADKAVYAYPFEHYAWWRAERPGLQFPPGAFGENLTLEGLDENRVCVGDRLQIGTAEFRVTQPRMPCFKLGIRFGEPEMIKWFHEAGRPGYYLTVLRTGKIAPGDSIGWSAGPEPRLPVATLARLYTASEPDVALVRQALRIAALPEGWRRRLERHLEDPA